MVGHYPKTKGRGPIFTGSWRLQVDAVVFEWRNIAFVCWSQPFLGGDLWPGTIVCSIPANQLGFAATQGPFEAECPINVPSGLEMDP